MLAHHGQDQVETLLMRMFQGRGCCPCEGMDRWARSFCRPFLPQDKSRLVDYLRAHGVAWVDDPSNSDTMFDRNFYAPKYYPRFVSGGQATLAACSDPSTIYHPAGAGDALCGASG